MEVFNPWPPVILPPPRVWTLPDPCCILNQRAADPGSSGAGGVDGCFSGVFSGGEIQKVFYFGLKILDDLVES